MPSRPANVRHQNYEALKDMSMFEQCATKNADDPNGSTNGTPMSPR